MFRILVVAENHKNVRLLNACLEVNNFSVITNREGSTIIETLHQKRPDLLILDLTIPSRGDWDLIRAILKDKGFEFAYVHVSLEGSIGIWVVSDVLDKIHGFRSAHLDIGPGCVEMDVAGNLLSGNELGLKEDPFRGSALVSGDHVLETKDVADGLLEPEIAARSGIGFISAYKTGPLAVAHGRGTAVRQQVDKHFLSRDIEEIVPCFI